MDFDRKSNVSSFYGGRKSSLDALNSDFPSPSTHLTNKASEGERIRHDSSSSFFNPDRTSRTSGDLLNGRSSNAGYNRGSFFPAAREEPLKGGRDEEDFIAQKDDAWDVYADFNNAGPRYSTAFGQPAEGYQALPGSNTRIDETASTVGPVEMVTVPALGPEWKRSEMRDMTKSGRREKKAESRAKKFKQWNRGERGICGSWFSRRVLVFTLFGLGVAIALVLAFTIPRVPSFAFNDTTPLANATGSFNASIPVQFSRAPANFTFPAFASLEANTQANYLPLTFKNIHATVFDLQTLRQVATGNIGHRTLPAKSFPPILLPLNFTYIATNDSDQTWLNWYNACKSSQLYPNGQRPAVQFRLILDMDIVGLPGSRSTSTQVSDANCPVELPESAP